MSVNVPERAECLGCGYLLRGLPEPICPECGRSFDPLDVRTFDVDPARRRRGRLVTRIGMAVAILALLYAFAPRRILKSTITFACTNCGEKTEVSRWEPVGPTWVRFRYPAFHWTTRTPSSKTPGPANAACGDHVYTVGVRADLYIGGFCSGSGTAFSAQGIHVNGQTATPESALNVLKAMVAPSNNGITIGPPPASTSGGL